MNNFKNNESMEVAKRIATDLLQEKLRVNDIDLKNNEKLKDVLEETLLEVTNISIYKDVNSSELKGFLINSVLKQEKINSADTIVLTSGENNEWLKNDYDRVSWTRWKRYRNYLTNKKKRPLYHVNNLDELTDRILTEIGNPFLDKPFDKRGLVVGEVQSGKTENYIALINKALDSGYGLIVVLSGIHNDLRSQTQMRVEAEVLGYNTTPKLYEERVIGVGKDEEIPINCITNRSADGDVNRNLLSCSVLPSSDSPAIFVIKKCESVLDSFVKYIKRNSIKTPTLIIDDEADQASIDTNRPSSNRNAADYEPSTINKLIRELLMSLKQKSYVGYTATPFANVLINHKTNHPQYSADLFPKDFIITLPSSNQYIGAERLFGLKDGNGLPIIREINKEEESDLSQELKIAIKSFIISIAVRQLRGQLNEHNSMLIHIDRTISSHGELSGMVSAELEYIQKQIVDDLEGKEKIITEFESIWNDDYVPTSNMMKIYNKIDPWNEVLQEIESVLAKEMIRVMVINGDSKDTLDYENNKERGLHVIAVGGDKLSRGLTLEGLTISYYLRDSDTYDTLMQMGRWFGYKTGFEDLCRIYTSKDLIESYRHIALATQELKESLSQMEEEKKKPIEFGLRIRAHKFLEVTNLLKRQDARPYIEFESFSGRFPQTVVFHSDEQSILSNYELTERLLKSLPCEKEFDENEMSIIWRNINADIIIQYLSEFKVFETSLVSLPRRWAEYIKKQKEEYGELEKVTIVLVSNSKSKDKYHIEIASNHCNRIYRQKLLDEL